MIHQAGFVGMVVGGMWGGFLESRKTMANFIENNQASVFDSHKEAKRKLNAVLGVAFGKGCFRMAWRLALFSSSYVYVLKLSHLSIMFRSVSALMFLLDLFFGAEASS